LYRQYFLNKNFIVDIPKYLTASPNNILLQELKASYLLMDPSTFSTEITREYLYKNIIFTKYKLLKEFIELLTLNNNLPINITFLFDYIYFYFFNINVNTNLNKNNDFFKNQYRPMKKGIVNMIRLHATGAIAMPTEIRLHILASSKDVIHS
jgi:hypothetical protein